VLRFSLRAPKRNFIESRVSVLNILVFLPSAHSCLLPRRKRRAAGGGQQAAGGVGVGWGVNNGIFFQIYCLMYRESRTVLRLLLLVKSF